TAATQLTITACLLGMALGQLFVGPLSDGTGRRGPLLCALVFFTLASACCVAARSGHGFIALRFAQGLGGAGGIVLSRAVACDLFRGPELTSFMSLLMAVNSVAPIAGPVLGGALAGLGGWPWVFIFLTGMGVALLLFCAFGLPETLPPKLRRQGGTRASLQATAALCRDPAFMCYVGMQGFTMGGFFGYVAASPFVFQGMYGISPTGYSLIFGGNALSVTIMALITGRLARSRGEMRLLNVGNWLRLVACLAVLAVTLLRPASPLPIMASLYAMLVLQGMTMPCAFTLAIEAQRVGAGTASGLLGVAMFLAGAASSPLVGLGGPDTAVPLGLICAASGLLALITGLAGNRLLARRRAQETPAQEQSALRPH
ncbi:multidrug effflux MFS transporter, partial [uncultured Desulfovibrio sp.]